VLIKTVDFPEPLLEAQRNRSLVIFAGAGVSIPPPSNYPDFKGLANQVAAGAWTLGENEPIERFLGGLVDKHISVHERVAELLANPDSRPTSLHFDLLRLFDSPSKARIVTTNFDLHFSSAARTVFTGSEECEVYAAPALPLGHFFNGIVYIHGAVDHPPRRLVLTDTDFGHAYLTEGWARLFLQRVFESFTVLFVGYSHDDPVMNYLARGFTPEMNRARRYALSVSGDEEKWSYRRVIPITYELTDQANHHSALADALATWATYAREGVLDTGERIQKLVQAGIPTNTETADFLQMGVNEPETLRFFLRSASSVDWLDWLDERKILDKLFDPRGKLSETDPHIAWWMAEQFMIRNSGQLMRLIHKHEQRIHFILWRVFVHFLSKAWTEDGNRKTLHRWLLFLVDSRPKGMHLQELEHLSTRLSIPADRDAALLLFDHLGAPSVEMQADLFAELDSGRKDVKLDPVCETTPFWLHSFWNKTLAPNLDLFGDQIAIILTRHLEIISLLFRAEQTDLRWDPLSIASNHVARDPEPHERNALQVLVDAAVSVARWNVLRGGVSADTLVDVWVRSDSIVLKRLSIFMVGEFNHWPSDKKIEWIIDREFLFRFVYKAEVEQAFESSYAGASAATRGRLVATILEDVDPSSAREHKGVQYEKFSLLKHLLLSDPNCTIAGPAAATIAAEYPEFIKMDVDDSSFKVQLGQVENTSPITVQSLLTKPPSDQVEFLRTFKHETMFGPTRDGLLANVRAATARQYGWGRALATALQSAGDLTSDLWAAILSGWGISELSSEQWVDLLALVDETRGLLSSFTIEVVALIQQPLKQKPPVISKPILSLVISIGETLWPVVSGTAVGQRNESERIDWVVRALNQTGGRYGEFLVLLVDAERKVAGVSSKGLSDRVRGMLEKVVEDPGSSAILARVTLMMELNFLYFVDSHWVVAKLVPLLDWRVHGPQVIPMLHGFVYAGFRTADLIPILIPVVQSAFPHVVELGRARDRFSHNVTVATILGYIRFNLRTFLQNFIREVQSEDRLSWTGYMSDNLRGLGPEQGQRIWDEWLAEYWKQRNVGIPVPLSSKELARMVGWSLVVGSAFPRVVDVIATIPDFEFKDEYFFTQLKESNFPAEFPVETAHLLLKVLRSTKTMEFEFSSVDAMVRTVTELGAPLHVVEGICDRLASLGYPIATDLRNWARKLDR